VRSAGTICPRTSHSGERYNIWIQRRELEWIFGLPACDVMDDSVPAEYEECFKIFRGNLSWVGIKRKMGAKARTTLTPEVCARNMDGHPRSLWYNARSHESSFSAFPGCAPVQMAWPGTMTRWSRPELEALMVTSLRCHEEARHLVSGYNTGSEG